MPVGWGLYPFEFLQRDNNSLTVPKCWVFLGTHVPTMAKQADGFFEACADCKATRHQARQRHSYRPRKPATRSDNHKGWPTPLARLSCVAPSDKPADQFESRKRGTNEKQESRAARKTTEPRGRRDRGDTCCTMGVTGNQIPGHILARICALSPFDAATRRDSYRRPSEGCPAGLIENIALPLALLPLRRRNREIREPIRLRGDAAVGIPK